MVTTHRITAEPYEDSFTLIAIHSPLEDYALAYALNKACDLSLKRMAKDLHVTQNLSFSAFEWEDTTNDVYWILIANRCVAEERIFADGFFAGHTSFTIHHFITKQKKVDYFLKVDTVSAATLDSQVKAIRTIPGIITVYPIAPQLLKSNTTVII